MSAHQFFDPLSQTEQTLVISSDLDSTGVPHEGCEHLAYVSHSMDAAFCNFCRWQCRISGAWFMDLWKWQREVGPTGDERG